MKPAVPWKTEAEMVGAFATVARESGFSVYPETSGWDLVLVSGDLQVGVQAKLRANVDVLAQAVDRRGLKHPGPDIRAVLVPVLVPAFVTIAVELDVWVLPATSWTRSRADGRWGRGDLRSVLLESAPRSPRSVPVWVPPFQPRMAGGVPSPSPVDAWKLGAIKLSLRLRRQGFVERSDFKEFGIKLNSHWTRRRAGRPPRLIASTDRGIYTMGPGTLLPDEEYPEVVEQMREAGLLDWRDAVTPG